MRQPTTTMWIDDNLEVTHNNNDNNNDEQQLSSHVNRPAAKWTAVEAVIVERDSGP